MCVYFTYSLYICIYIYITSSFLFVSVFLNIVSLIVILYKYFISPLKESTQHAFHLINDNVNDIDTYRRHMSLELCCEIETKTLDPESYIFV